MSSADGLGGAAGACRAVEPAEPILTCTVLTPAICDTPFDAPLWSAALVAGAWVVNASVNDTSASWIDRSFTNPSETISLPRSGSLTVRRTSRIAACVIAEGELMDLLDS